MITVVYQSRDFAPERVARRYVRTIADGTWRVFEVTKGSSRYAPQAGGATIREWDTEDGTLIPQHVRDEADRLKATRVIPSAVEWA